MSDNLEPKKLQETLSDPDAEPKRCNFFVERKKRSCRMLVKKGRNYCGQHLIADPSVAEDGFKRIPCPLDPKHSCYEHRLESHLAHCNAREREYVYKHININVDEDVEEPPKKSLRSLDDDQLLGFVKKVRHAYKEFIGSLKEEILHHEALNEIISTPGFGLAAIRHLTQNSSLLGHLRKFGVLNGSRKTSFIEFGAGRGKLTSSLIDAVGDTTNTNFVLVDRGAQRYKCDGKLKYNTELKLHRLRIDIQHLDLKHVECIVNSQQVVGCGKHLCGAATDLTLRCLTQEVSSKVAAVVIALCCHHRCTWQSYTGKEFLKDAGFCAEDFYIILALTSWAVCSSRDLVTESASSISTTVDSRVPISNDVEDIDNQVNSQEHDISKEEKIAETRNENRYARLDLTASVREEIGRETKQLLDFGRVQFLSSRGFEASLVEYVSKEMTLENVALLAKPRIKNI